MRQQRHLTATEFAALDARERRSLSRHDWGSRDRGQHMPPPTPADRCRAVLALEALGALDVAAALGLAPEAAALMHTRAQACADS